MEKNPYQIIRTNQPGYSKVFRTIADYILENPEQVLQGHRILGVQRTKDYAGKIRAAGLQNHF